MISRNDEFAGQRRSCQVDTYVWAIVLSMAMNTDKHDMDGKCSNVEVGHDTRQDNQGEHANPNNRPN